MKLKLNISPCPNDTFMFEAMLSGRIDCEGLEFELGFADIELLNRSVLETGDFDGGEFCAKRLTAPDICKVSYAILPEVIERYTVLNSGSALGRGNGPLLVSKEPIDTSDSTLRVVVPGIHTTANLLMQSLYPKIVNRTSSLFSEIADRIMAGEFDAGVLIHEGRFTYAERGLRLVADLGLEWEQRTKLPLPLGAIVVSRRLPVEIQQKIDRVVQRSVKYALDNPCASEKFVRQYAQELELDVLRSHIELFVNDFSLDLGKEGRRAVLELTQMTASNHIFVKR